MGKIAVVILCHGDDQVENLEPLPADTFTGADLVVVALSSGRMPSLQFRCLVFRPTHGVTGFNAGANRDEGLGRVLAIYPDASVVFLDGDCRPSPDWLRHHADLLTSSMPMVTCGTRRERCRPDARLEDVSWDGRIWLPTFRPGFDAWVQARCDVDGHRTTWSCSLGVNRPALLRLRTAGRWLWRSPRIFPPFFDGRWGGEDTALGVVAWEAGCSIAMLDPLRSHVDHEPHRSRAAKENLDLVPEFTRSVRSCAFWSTFEGQEAP